MGGMGAAGAFGQPQAQAQGQQGQGNINFQDLLQVNNLEKVPFIQHFIKKIIRLFYTAVLSCKGQLISKSLFVDFNFFQKANENTSH